MKRSAFLLNLAVTYFAATLGIASTLVAWYFLENPNYQWRPQELIFTFAVSGIFGLPVFGLVGLPYLALGFRSWGREHGFLFVFVGTILGGLGGAAFGTILAMPLPIPPFMPAAGLVAGAICSVVWALLCRERLKISNA